jgi:TP901 family phage tail tape measure protein
MAASVQIPVTQTGLEASIQAALRNAGKGAQINLGTNSRQINALAQPLGRITGQADEFTKSMEAANARVFAFGASIGIINGVSSAFSALVKSTIAVEKSLTEINSVFEKSSSELEKFGNSLFDVAKNTGQSFDAVAKGALELARQGLSTEESLRRINDALILTRLSGLDAERSVSGLTAAVNAFKSTGITTSEVLNKLVVVSQKYSVSEKDLIEGLKRSSSVAKQAGVSFDELVGIITAVQEKTSVGGAVIGNSFKTIFTRLQRTDTLDALQQLGVSVTDVQGRILPATKLLENLAGTIKSLNQVQLAEITERVGGGFQIDKLIATLEDLSSQSSVAFKATELSLKSTNEAYEKNAALNVTLAALINKTTLSAEQLGATLGKIGITDSAKSLLGFFNGLLEGIQKILGEESALGDVFRGLAKGIGNLVTGPGLALFAAIILKLSKDLAQFGFASLKGFFGIGKAAKEIQNVEQSIASALSRNVGLQRQLFALEGNRAAQIKLMSDAIVLQEAAMRRMASTASTLAAPLYGAGVRSTGEGLRVPRAAGGYTPAVSQESSDIRKGVGGARSGDRPVVIPNFNFGQGKKGSIVAHTGEYAVPNFAGSGGTAIFNRDMVRSMGLPSGAKKIGASGGLIPNFATFNQREYDSLFNKFKSGTKVADLEKYASGEGRDKSPEYIKAAKDALSFKSVKFSNVWNAETAPSSVMLLPNASPGVEFSHMFKDPYPDKKGYDSFVGRAYGIDPFLSKDSKFQKLLNLDSIMDESLANAANFVLQQVQPDIDPKPESVNSSNIKNLISASGGAGALGSIRGALFEAVTNAIVKGISQESVEPSGNNTLDVAFGRSEKRNVLEEIFGLPNNRYDFGDYKNSLEQKDKYVRQVIDNLGPLKKSKVRRAAGGFIPNFVSQSRRIGSGAEASFLRLGSKDGMDIGVKKFYKDGPKNALSQEWLISQYINRYLNIPGIYGPKTLSGFNESNRRGSIRKEIISGKLGKIALGSEKARFFGLGTLRSAVKTKGLDLPDLHGANYILNKNAENYLSKFSTYPSDPVGSIALLREMASNGGVANLIDPGFARLTGSPARDVVDKMLNYLDSKKKTAARGFLPNFANPLKDAIGREMAAGVPASQIYVDKNPSLKSIGNPMGLMVANRRDEPAGGYQGINRAIKEGRDPKTYGAASGFVPNYADAPDISEYVGKTRSVALSEEVKNYIKSLKELAKAYKDAKKDLQYIQNQRSPEAAAARDRIKAIKDDAKALKKSSEATRKAIIEQSKGIFGTGKTATLKETTVRAQGGQKDMLGTIFALQGAFSILSGYTENLTGRMGVVAKEITNLGSGLSTAAFAFQGAQRIATESTGILGKSLGNLGMVGAGAMMAFEVFKFGKQLYSEYSGANERAAKSAIMLADAAQKAAFSLDKYSPAAQDRLNKRAEEIFKKFNIQGLQEVETVEVKKAIKDTLISGASNKLVEDALKQSITTTKNYVTDRTTGERIEISGTNTLTQGDLEGLTRRLTEVQQNTDITGLAKLQELILGGATAEDVSLNTALREMVGSLYDFDFAGIADRIEKSSIDELTQAENIIKNAVVNQAQLGGGSELATMLDKEDFNLETALQFITQVIKKRKEDKEVQDNAAVATERQFKIDTSRFRAAQDFEKKMKTFKEQSFAQEMSQKEAIFAIEQNTNLSEDEKQKQINATNAGYEMRLNALKATEEQQRNLNQAISESLSGAMVSDKSVLNAENFEKLAQSFANLDFNNLEPEKITEMLESYGIVGEGLTDKLIPALQEALVKNKDITEEQKKQIQSSIIQLGIDQKRIDLATARALVEAKISNKIEARQSTQLYQQELLSLDNSARMLSINQDIEKVKSNYTLTEYERAKKIVELEKEKKTLSEEGIDLESSQKRLDLEQKTLAELRQQVKASKDISDDKIKDKLILEGTNVESLATKAMAYKDTNAQNIYNEYLAQKDLIDKRDELARKGLITTGETPEQAYLRKKEGGVFEGMNTALRAMTDEVDMFAYNLGEKIPQMFADNMSQAISQMIEEGKSFGEVLQGAAYNFVKEINSAMIKNLSQKAATSLLGTGKEGSSGLLGSIFGYASGGPITGGSGTKDDVPAMLMGGEYVINKKSVGRYGPKFLEAINNGTLGGYAKGGKVQSGKGGFFTPGTYGLGGIQGTGNLLKFATQGYTSGARDMITNAAGYQSIALEPESARLTNLGRSNSPQAEATRAAKEQAFGLYVQEIQAQEEARKQAEAQSDAFKKQLIMSAVLAAGSYVGGIAKTGFQQGIAGAAEKATTWQKFTAGLSGVGEKFGNVGSGLSSLFSGNMNQAGEYFSMANTNFASKIPTANIVDEVVKNISKSPSISTSRFTGVSSSSNNQGDLPLLFPDENPIGSFENQNSNNTPFGGDFGNNAQGSLLPDIYPYQGNDNREIQTKAPTSKFPRRNATGGSIPFNGGIDTVPAMLSGGEFVMNRSAAQNIGAGNLQALNAGAGSIVTEEKTEELNDKLIAKLDELIEASGGGGSITINVEGSGGATNQTTSGQTSEQKQQLARQIKDAVVKVIQEEKRLGGSLRR